MTFDEYWRRLEKSNPGLRTHVEMNIKVSAFEKCMKQAFEAGASSAESSKSLFESIFGSKPF